MDKFTSQIKLSAPSQIKRVLSVSAHSAAQNCECTSGVVSVSGKTTVNVIYLSVDGLVERASGDVEFIEKQQCAYELDNAFLVDDATCEIQATSNSEIMVGVSHNVSVSGIYKYELTNFDESAKDLVLSKKTFSGMKLVSSAQDNFVVAEECESNIVNMSILQADASVILGEANCTLDKIVVEGKVCVNVFETDGENFGLITKEFEFKQEIAAQNVTPNMVANAVVSVKNITVTPEEKDNKTNLVFAIDVSAKAYAYEETTYEAVVDMFSLSSEIATKNSYIEAKNYHSTEVSSENVTLLANVSNIENFDDILGVFMGKLNIKSAQDEGGKAVISGTATAHALVRANGEISTLFVENDINFEIAKDANFDLSDVVAELQILSSKVKAGKELEISAKITCTAEYDQSISECFVESYEALKEKPESAGGIKVYVASKGETLFGVAKALSVKPEIIASQNELPEILEQGEKIYVYSPINLI